MKGQQETTGLGQITPLLPTRVRREGRQTFKNTTQNASNVIAGRHLYRTLKSPFPAFNVWRRNEPVATDTIFVEIPAIDNGATMGQLFIGRYSVVIDIYEMNSEKEFVNTLLEVIRERGAMDKLISDSARVEQSQRVEDVLRMLLIQHWKTEPGYQHQHFAEHRWGHFKHNIQWYSHWRKIPGEQWLLLAKWIADIIERRTSLVGPTVPIGITTGVRHGQSWQSARLR